MKKYAWMLFAVLTVGLLGACARPAESAAGEAGELAMLGQASRFKLSGDGDRLWLAGWGEGELLVWQSGDGGDSWQREEVDWPQDASPTAVTSLLPGGRMLVSAVDGEGTCLLAGGPGEAFAKLDLPALDGYDGCAASRARAGAGRLLQATASASTKLIKRCFMGCSPSAKRAASAARE